MSHRDVEEIRARLDDPMDVCSQLGLLDGRPGRDYLRQTAGGVTVRCPAHDERTPSCSVTRGPDGTLRVRCFGCDFAGDVFHLIGAALRTSSFPDQLREGAHLAGWRLADAPSDWRPAPRPAPRELPPGTPPLDGATFNDLAGHLLDVCPIHAQPDVCAYLVGRGLHAHVSTWGALPPPGPALWALRDQLVARFGQDVWLRSGLAVREGERAGAWAWPHHRLVIPWREPTGRVSTIQRRAVEALDGARKYVFAAGRQPLHPYGMDDACEELGAATAVAFVEGATDTVALRALSRRAGQDRVVVGVPGVQGWRPAWADMAAGRPALLAFDADAAVTRATHRRRTSIAKGLRPCAACHTDAAGMFCLECAGLIDRGGAARAWVLRVVRGQRREALPDPSVRASRAMTHRRCYGT